MATNLFTLNQIEDCAHKINIDDLYEGRRQKDLNELSLFNKILARIHIRIKTTARQAADNQSCWFVVPEVIIGVSGFNQADCIAYVMHKLTENGFRAKYFHPNTLFIAWNHWVPTYVRTEIKKKYNIVVSETGEEVMPDPVVAVPEFFKPRAERAADPVVKKREPFTPVDTYKPTSMLFNALKVKKTPRPGSYDF